MSTYTEDKTEVSYRGSAMKRLMVYVKPYWHYMAFSLLLVLFLTGLELYRPILVGDAIDDYINGYNKPYAVVEQGDKGAFSYHGKYYSKTFTPQPDMEYAQLLLYQDTYYLFESLGQSGLEQISNWENTMSESAEPAKISTNGTLLLFSENGEPLFATDSLLLQGTPQTSSDLKILRSTDFSGIQRAAVIYIAVLLFNFLFNAVQTWVLQLTGQKIIYNIRQELFTHIQSLSLRYFDINPVGRLVTRVTNDVEALNEMYSGILVRLFRNIVKIIGLAAVMIVLNPRLALYSFVLLPIVMVLTVVFRKIARKTYRIARTKLTDLNTFLSENISGMKVIQIFAREKEKYKEFEHKSHKLFRAYYKEMMVFAVFRPLIYMLSVLSLVIVIYFGGSSVLRGVISLGTLYIFLQYIVSFFEPIQELAEQFSTLQSSIASAEKIFTILDEEPMVKDAENPVSLPQIKGRIEFIHVWFAYENEDYVLRDVSFTIEPGQKVAFVGATGAGKSSILNLIGRYYDIQKGQILIDGIDIRQLDKKQLRSAIGQVQQDVFLFTGDIKSNIRLRREEITMEKIKKSAEHVNASHFIERLPDGYDEPVSERGSTLSAGQRQLLSFARTLAYEPKILVMDEATANIDTETELLIQEALENLMKDRTTIMVAHRLSTIQHADNILVMHKGKIRESGTHQELLLQDGIYKKLYELQLHSS